MRQLCLCPFGIPHYDNVHYIGQGLNVGGMPPTKYVYSNYIFKDLGNDHKVGLWILKTHCEQNLGQEFTYYLVLIHPHSKR